MQLPILYNSEKKAKSVGCKIEDMRSPGILGCLWMNARGNTDRRISSNSPAQLEIKDTINECL